MTTFWKHASADQRLAQIDGALELGMTSAQCAANVGAKPQAVASFARYHGRPFPKDGEQAAKKYAAGKSKGGRKGGQVSSHIAFRKRWERSGFNTANAITARIFDDEHDSGNLFDPAPYDNEVFA